MRVTVVVVTPARLMTHREVVGLKFHEKIILDNEVLFEGDTTMLRISES
jgi:hypothetical protein